MMFISLLITFLLVANNAAEVAEDDLSSEENEIKKEKYFSVENEWRRSARTKADPSWMEGVQRYYTDAIVSLRSFPSELSTEADLVKTTFQTLLIKLIDSSNSQSEILSTGATSVLETFALVNIDPCTAQGIIDEFYRMLPIIMQSYRTIVTNLSPIIGDELASEIINAMNDLEGAFKLYVEKFNAGDGHGRKKEVDYEPVMECVQKLFSTMSLKGVVKLSQLQLATEDVGDAMLILSFVLDHIMICSHGIGSCTEAVLIEQRT